MIKTPIRAAATLAAALLISTTGIGDVIGASEGISQSACFAKTKFADRGIRVDETNWKIFCRHS